MVTQVRSISQTGVTEPFELQVARGQIPGHSIVHKFGANFDLDNGSVPETIWSAGGLYPWSALSTAQTLYLISTDAADTSTVDVQGLDANYNSQTETVQLNGTTAVATSNTFIRVFRMQYNTGTGNEGTITARVTSGTGTVVAQIDEGLSQTLMSVYTVPAGYTGYLCAFDFTCQKNKDAQLNMFVREPGGTFRIKHVAEMFENQYHYKYAFPLEIPEKSDIDIRADDVESNNTRVTSNFDLLLIKNEGPI